MLTLYEELYLLALDDEKGNLVSFARKSFAFPLAGAILAELALLGKLALGEKNRLALVEAAPTGDPIIDDALEQLQVSEKARKPTYWVSSLSEEPKKLRQSVGERLAEQNVLRQDDKRFFRLAFATGSSEAVPDKFQMKHRLRASILSDSPSDPRTLVLLKLIMAGELLGLIFTQDEIQMAGWVIQKQFLAAALGNSAMRVVEEIEQAVCSVREDEAD